MYTIRQAEELMRQIEKLKGKLGGYVLIEKIITGLGTIEIKIVKNNKVKELNDLQDMLNKNKETIDKYYEMIDDCYRYMTDNRLLREENNILRRNLRMRKPFIGLFIILTIITLIIIKFIF